MQMELISNTHIPDGLLAAMTLLSEKPRQGVPSRKSALHPGIDERNCTAVLGLRFRWSGIVSGTVVAPNNNDPSLQLAQALGKTGVYSLNSVCFVPAFYATSAALASPVAFSTALDAAGAFLEAASEDILGTFQKGIDWANGAPARMTTRAPAIGGTIKTTNALVQYCGSH
jgi:hypothetical protein